jgi:hypothetical protein
MYFSAVSRQRQAMKDYPVGFLALSLPFASQLTVIVRASLVGHDSDRVAVLLTRLESYPTNVAVI